MVSAHRAERPNGSARSFACFARCRAAPHAVSPTRRSDAESSDLQRLESDARNRGRRGVAEPGIRRGA